MAVKPAPATEPEKTAPPPPDPKIVAGNGAAGIAAAVITPSNGADPFDPVALRLDQSYGEVGVKKLLTTVPVGKPGSQDWYRVHPGEAYRLTPAAVLELRDERETYLIPPVIAEQIPGEFRLCTVFTTINRQGVIRLWAIPLPDEDGRHHEAHRSAMEGAERAMNTWLRTKWSRPLMAYEHGEAGADLGEPKWDKLPPFPDLLRIAFRGKLIDSLDHPVLKLLLAR